jgi:hypothetical protein
MHRLPARRTRAFILRIWTEYLDQSPPTWRGEIEDVSNREVERFGSAEELLASLRRCLAQDREYSEREFNNLSKNELKALYKMPTMPNLFRFQSLTVKGCKDD